LPISNVRFGLEADIGGIVSLHQMPFHRRDHVQVELADLRVERFGA